MLTKDNYFSTDRSCRHYLNILPKQNICLKMLNNLRHTGFIPPNEFTDEIIISSVLLYQTSAEEAFNLNVQGDYN